MIRIYWLLKHINFLLSSIYYRLFDFLKDCYNIGVQYSYQEVEMIVENPSAREIGLLFTLLRDETEKEIFLQICRNTYVMQS